MIFTKKPQNSQLTVSNDFLNIQRQKSYFAGAGAGASAAAVMHTSTYLSRANASK